MNSNANFKNKIVYAHNAEYDLSAIYGNIYKLDPNAIFNGKFISCTNGVCRFADSFNLLPASVESIGELIGIHKKKLGNVKKTKEGNIISSVKHFWRDVDYCERDCEIVYKALQGLFDEAEPSYTIGSLSLKIFRANFLQNTIKVNGLCDKFFDALYGGRTEAFKIGTVDANVYDINSAYPYAMRELRFPDPSRVRFAKTKDWQMYLRERERSYYKYEGMISATVTISDKINIPMLPFRGEDKLLFPVGTFRGSWTLNEFRYAYLNFDVSVNKVHELIISESIESPFIEFIDHYYELRNNTKNEFERYRYKLFMNNLYGKLIQRARDEYRYCETIQDAKDFMKTRKIKRVELIDNVDGSHFLRYDIDRIFSHTIAPWGAYITAFVRIMLHKQIMKHPDEVVYCDTDSYMGEINLPMNDSHLGGWKKEKKKVIEVRTLKDYVYIEENPKTKKMEKKQSLKGVKKDAIQMDEFANVFVMKRMIKTRESFRRVDNLPPGTFVTQMKVLTGDYSKRKIRRDGSTAPFKFKQAA
jgi:hypothetical protein